MSVARRILFDAWVVDDVDVRHDADNAARERLAEERLGPPHVPVDRFAVREQSLRDALGDDRHRLAVAAVGVRELAAGQQLYADYREEPWRDEPESGVGILLAVRR